MPTKTKPTTPTNKTAELAYQSNPFSLSFNKFGQFFEKNLSWAIALLVLSIFGLLFQVLGSVLDTTSSDVSAIAAGGSEATPMAIGAIALLVVVSAIFIATIVVISVAINVFITGLFAYAALENDAGRIARLGAAIDAVVARFWRLFLAQLLATTKIFAWALLFIIPGVVAAFRYALLPYVILDQSAQEKGVKASHDRVKALVAGRKREVFGVATVAIIIPIVGGINQLVGNAALYRQLQVYNDKKLVKPPVHWLNYFGFILIGLYLLLIGFIVVLAILAIDARSN